MMTQQAQGALRRGDPSSLFRPLSVEPSVPMPFSMDGILRLPKSPNPKHSHRTVHEECAVLHHLQLRQQDYPSDSEQMHAVQVRCGMTVSFRRFANTERASDPDSSSFCVCRLRLLSASAQIWTPSHRRGREAPADRHRAGRRQTDGRRQAGPAQAL